MKDLKHFLVVPLFLIIFLSPRIESQDSNYDRKFVRCDVGGVKTAYLFMDNLLYVATLSPVETQRTEKIVSSTKTSATYDTRNSYLGKITIDFSKNTYSDNFGTIRCEGGYLDS